MQRQRHAWTCPELLWRHLESRWLETDPSWIIWWNQPTRLTHFPAFSSQNVFSASRQKSDFSCKKSRKSCPKSGTLQTPISLLRAPNVKATFRDHLKSSFKTPVDRTMCATRFCLLTKISKNPYGRADKLDLHTRTERAQAQKKLMRENTKWKCAETLQN